jgi:hypothetical protein
MLVSSCATTTARRSRIVYLEEEPGPAIGGQATHKDEARRIAANIVPELLRKA